jgi:2'-hydroxyisoflavone reductase
MKLLILGGTIFLGRHIVDAALRHGHTVTLFNRGRHRPDLFPGVERLTGDRDGGLDALGGRTWDAVIDTCGYVPRVARQSAERLRDAVGHYTFISSISVYKDIPGADADEETPVSTLDDPTVETITGETYGPLKALCEKAVQDALGTRAFIVRPGLLVGPHDPSDRFTYWPARVARGGEVLAPEKPEAPIQIIDGRDLADFIIQLIEGHAFGIYNATGPEYELTMGRLLETSKQVSGSDAQFKWASVDFLKQNNVQSWSDMPVWIPADEEGLGAARVDVSKAIQAGLRFRPLEATVRDTLAWARTRPADHEWRAGLKPEREQELLALRNK